MADSDSVKDSVPAQPPFTFWYILVLVLLAPVQLSRHIQTIISSDVDNKSFYKLMWVQFCLILPALLPVYALPENKQTLFIYGAACGVAIILLVPMVYINFVRLMMTGENKSSKKALVESFLRGASRLWVFYLIGGLLGLLIGRPIWSEMEYTCALGLGYASANAMSLMLIMSQIDVMGYAQTQEILSDSHTGRKLKPLLFGVTSGLFLFAHFLPVLAKTEHTIIYPSLASLLAVAFAGLAIGTRYSLGWLVGTVASLVTNSKTVLRHDELGVIMYWRLKSHLETLRNQETVLPYCKEVAYFLPWSPWKEKILNDFIAWLEEDSRQKSEKVEIMLDLALPDLSTLITNLGKWADANPSEGAIYIILRRIFEGLSSDALHLNLRMPVKNRAPLPETFRSWFRLLPKRFPNQKVWSRAFEKKLAEAGGECDLATAFARNEVTRKVVDTAFARYIRKLAETYFQPPQDVIPVVEWQQTTCYLKNNMTETDVVIENTSALPIKVHEVTVSLFSKTSPAWFATKEKNATRHKTLQVKIGISLEPSEKHTIFVPLRCESDQVEVGLALEMAYTFRKESGRDAGFHESKMVRLHTLLLCKERPFLKISPNPYSRGPVKTEDKLFGRDKIVNSLVSLLAASPCKADYVLITGERRIGKTSLLYVIKEKLLQAGIPVVYYDAQRFEYESKKRAMEGDKTIHMLSFLAEAYQSSYVPNEICTISAIDDFFTMFSERIAVFLLDEFDAYFALLSPDEQRFWESKPLHGTPVSMVCSVPESDVRTKSTDWLNNFFGTHNYSLSPLSSTAAHDLIIRPLKDWISFEPGAISTILRFTGGFPIYLQAVCEALVNYMNRKSKSSVVTCSDIEHCLMEVPDSISRLMASYISALPDKEMEVLILLSQHTNRLGLEEVSGRLLTEAITSMKQRDLIYKSGEFVSCTAELLLSKELLNIRSLQ